MDRAAKKKSNVERPESYRSLRCTDSTRNVDKAILRYITERNIIIEKLANDPSSLTKEMWVILSNDSYCMVNCGELKKFNPFICSPCKNMNSLVDFEKTKLGQPFIIECGKKVGTYLSILKVMAGKTHLEISEKDKESASKFLERNNIMISCGSHDISDLTFLKADTFSNNILNWWTIDSIFESKKLPYSLPLYTAYICRDDGFILFESPTLGNFDKIVVKSDTKSLKSTIISIFKQLGVILDVLSDYYFSHGTPSSEVLVFTEEEISHEYKGVKVVSEFVMHLADFSYSSLTKGKTRLYPHNGMASSIIASSNMNITIDRGMYKLSNKSEIIFVYIRHGGLPIYSCSLDFYCFLVSMMSNKKVFELVKNDKDLYKLWKSVWNSDEVEIIETEIQKWPNEDPMKVLRNKWLQCGVVQNWLNALKEIN